MEHKTAAAPSLHFEVEGDGLGWRRWAFGDSPTPVCWGEGAQFNTGTSHLVAGEVWAPSDREDKPSLWRSHLVRHGCELWPPLLPHVCMFHSRTANHTNGKREYAEKRAVLVLFISSILVEEAGCNSKWVVSMETSFITWSWMAPGTQERTNTHTVLHHEAELSNMVVFGD